MANLDERISKIEKILFGSDTIGDKGLFADYIVSKRILKYLSVFSGIILTTLISVSITLLKYNIDLMKEITRLSTLIEQHIGGK